MKTIISLVLALAAGQVSAASLPGWVSFSVTADGATNYLNENTIKKEGGFVTLWVLTDRIKPIKHPQGELVYSDLVFAKFDCLNKRIQLLEVKSFSQGMTQGKEVGEAIRAKPNQPWIDVKKTSPLYPILGSQYCK